VPPHQCSKEKTNMVGEEEYVKLLEKRPLLKKRPDLEP
jgi:hypothetical protein